MFFRWSQTQWRVTTAHEDIGYFAHEEVGYFAHKVVRCFVHEDMAYLPTKTLGTLHSEISRLKTLRI
jgi:hypothetical protein